MLARVDAEAVEAGVGRELQDGLEAAGVAVPLEAAQLGAGVLGQDVYGAGSPGLLLVAEADAVGLGGGAGRAALLEGGGERGERDGGLGRADVQAAG